jgi:hypothetical protein
MMAPPSFASSTGFSMRKANGILFESRISTVPLSNVIHSTKGSSPIAGATSVGGIGGKTERMPGVKPGSCTF